MFRGSAGAGLRRVAETLRESEQRFQALLDSVGAGLLLSRPDAVVRMCNRAGIELLGLRKDELIGASLFDPKPFSVAAVSRKVWEVLDLKPRGTV
jgi:PAS domain S-box-containing protein